ncbi:MAG: hypothetical protein NT098_02730, partial [Candidatus Parcubacteria bacterium]|nr:hypothetical protein [Candidatus Parcubacteria bacterium]
PNAVSWALWTMTSTLNLTSYFVITDDFLKVGMSAVSTLACLLTFIFLLGKKSWAPLSHVEKITLGIGIISAFAWWQFHSAISGNLILQFAIIAGFISTYRSIWKNPSEESLFAWTLFTLAYASLATTVVLCGNGSLPELIYPFLGLTLHFTSAFLIVIRRRSLRLDIIKQVV